MFYLFRLSKKGEGFVLWFGDFPNHYTTLLGNFTLNIAFDTHALLEWVISANLLGIIYFIEK